MIVLRPYQEAIIKETRSLMAKGIRSVLIQSPTGSGKTALTAHMLETASSRGLGSWFICHRRELVKQSMEAFAAQGISFGIISAGFMEDQRPLIQIASIQSLARRHQRFPKPKLIVVDECHHLPSASWSRLISVYKDAFLVGLTATPERLDGKGLGDHFQEMVQGPSVQWLIEHGFLSPYRLFAPAGVQTQGVHTAMGDFVKSELSRAADKPSITGDAIAHYRKHADGKRAVVFAVSIEHSKHIVEQFNKTGIPAEHVDGETSTEVRDGAIKRFKEGKTKILANVELFGEGFDLPAIESVILLRPTFSYGLFVQQVGRSLRPFEGKHQAIILDHAGNTARHGLPDGPRTWSLVGSSNKKSRKNDDVGPTIRICPKCFAAQFPGRSACQYCGFAFEIESREVEEKEGELSEVDVRALRRQQLREQGNAASREDLLALAIKRRYKNPLGWVHHILQARQARKLAEGRR